MNPNQSSKPKTKIVLLAEDDADDIYLIGEAIDECGLDARVLNVQDGEELLQMLRHQDKYQSSKDWPRPDLILLDLNMPLKDGREALSEIKADPDLCTIPVVVLTTSKADDDLEHSYAVGASGFVTKPVSFSGLRDAIQKIGEYWLATVKLPDDSPHQEG